MTAAIVRNESAHPLRLVVADDSLLIREGIAELLAKRGFDVVAQAADGPELLRKVAAYRPDVAIADIRMPPSGTDEGLRAAASIAKRHPETAVLILSEYLDAQYATRLLEAGTPGRGYLLKATVRHLGQLVDAIHRIAAGESVVDAAIVSHLLERRRERNPLDRLTARQREILALVAEGRSNHGIAQHLVLSERTVENHVRRMLMTLGVVGTCDDHRRVLAVLLYLRASP